jgi:deoxyribodipyrimidine photo-lyase
MQNVVIFWFRRDLRLHDNAGLFHALSRDEAVLPLFIFDTHILNDLKNKKDKRVDFIHQSLQKIQEKLLAVGSSLYIVNDTPQKAFEKITHEFAVKAVYANHDYEPSAIERDEKIAKYLQSKNIAFHTFKDQVIFEKNEVLKADGTPYTVFTPYSKIWKQRLQENPITTFDSEKLEHNFIKISSSHFPSLNEIGFEKSELIYPEAEWNETIIKKYHDTRNIPSIKGTSLLSVHLRFGTISIRKLVKRAVLTNEQWLNELIWREFFMMILFHFPHVVKNSFKSKYDKIEWRNNEQEFKAWCEGKTGYPIVDAGMRELNETGFMHNRVRMIVASFLTKHLLIDWRWGEAYFAEKLLDYELSANNGNWQWAAGSGCDAAPYFRIFNPEEQTKKFDPEEKYIRRWVKEKYAPIVEHKFARERCLEVYKKAVKE